MSEKNNQSIQGFKLASSFLVGLTVAAFVLVSLTSVIMGRVPGGEVLLNLAVCSMIFGIVLDSRTKERSVEGSGAAVGISLRSKLFYSLAATAFVLRWVLELPAFK